MTKNAHTACIARTIIFFLNLFNLFYWREISIPGWVSLYFSKIENIEKYELEKRKEEKNDKLIVLDAFQQIVDGFIPSTRRLITILIRFYF